MTASHSNKKYCVAFVPTFKYSSNPLFISIAKIINAYYKTVYLDLKDPFMYYNALNSNEIDCCFHDYLSLDYDSYDFLNKYLKFGLIKKILYSIKFLVEAKNYQKIVEKAINNLMPDAIITASDSLFSTKIINIWAVNNSRPFIVYQPTFIDTNYPGWIKRFKTQLLYLIFNRLFKINLFNKQLIFGNEFSSNYIFVWGDKFMDPFKETKIIDNVRIVGNPIFNEIFKEKSGKHKALNLKPKITICTEALQSTIGIDLDNMVRSTYLQLIRNNPDYDFVLKLHPRDSKSDYEKYFQNHNLPNLIIIDNIALSEVYKDTDVQISVNSYSSFEAIIYGIPIILFKKELLVSKDYYCGEIELDASNFKELNEKLKKALSSEYRKLYETKRIKFLESRIKNFNSNINIDLIDNLFNVIN